jgi:hypothetical protein
MFDLHRLKYLCCSDVKEGEFILFKILCLLFFAKQRFKCIITAL